MQDDSQTLQSLSQTMPQIGKLEAIIVRPARLMPAIQINQTLAIANVGLQDDRRGIEHNPSLIKISNRQVTLIQAEHIEVIAKLMRLPNLQAASLRRNLIVSGINLLAVKPLFAHQKNYLHIGEVVLEVTGICAPCSRMEEILGEGGYNAMRGHGGVIARVIKGGVLREGNAVNLYAVTSQLSLEF
ncbi:MAG: MOSC domain-containing protein [Methylotenera sp.]|nr:MOSC domain-containing protein [Methylotenera sp.]